MFKQNPKLVVVAVVVLILIVAAVIVYPMIFPAPHVCPTC